MRRIQGFINRACKNRKMYEEFSSSWLAGAAASTLLSPDPDLEKLGFFLLAHAGFKVHSTRDLAETKKVLLPRLESSRTFQHWRKCKDGGFLRQLLKYAPMDEKLTILLAGVQNGAFEGQAKGTSGGRDSREID